VDLNYIDTSFLAPYYLPESTSETVEKKLRRLPGGSLVISPLVRAEFASLLSRKFRAREMKEAAAHRTLTTLDRHLSEEALRMVSIIATDFRQATEWIMAMRHSLRVPDAVHIAVAARHDAVFWTLDKELAKAAKWVGLTTRR